MYSQYVYWKAEMHNTFNAHNIFTEQMKKSTVYIMISMAYISS